MDGVARGLDVPAGMLARIVALMGQRLSVLVALRATVSPPDWIRPAVRDGHLAMFSGWWAPLARLGDALRDLGVAHAASSMVRVARDGELSLYRHGAQDAASGLDPQAYVRRLAAIDID